MTPGTLLAISVGALILSLAVAKRSARGWVAALLVSVVAAFAAAGWILMAGEVWTWRSAWTVGGEPVSLRLDGVSALFLALLAVVGGAGAVYAVEYWSDREHPVSAPGNRAWWNGLLLCMGLVLVCANGLHFLIAWELFALCGFLPDHARWTEPGRAVGRLAVSGGVACGDAGVVCVFWIMGRPDGKLGAGPAAGGGGIGAALLAGVVRVWGESGFVSVAHLAAVGACERAQSCLGHFVGGGH